MLLKNSILLQEAILKEIICSLHKIEKQEINRMHRSITKPDFSKTNLINLKREMMLYNLVYRLSSTGKKYT